ncbi:MAG: dTDP-4-dehydrorhamnose reductase [Patescibacteria group bacterium]|nr:dTDP-4-dehydrorhamnose reductase [Patescibacteria group bacterium]
MENKQKILILGAHGNLGQQLSNIFLLDKDYEVVAWDKNDLDITNKNETNKKIVQLNPSLIINASAYNAVDACEKDEEQFELAKKINGYAVGYIAKVAEKIGAIFVHFSTDYVFDGRKKDGYKENDKPNPINKYGKTKLIGEQELIQREKYGLKYYLIRTSKLFGPKGSGKNIKESFFDLILESSKERKKFNMVRDEEISCFTYTLDLARKVKKILENKKSFGIYHITNSSECDWYEASKFLFNITKKEIKIIPVSSNEFQRPAKRPKYSVLLNTKSKSLRSYQDALKEYLNIT